MFLDQSQNFADSALLNPPSEHPPVLRQGAALREANGFEVGDHEGES